MDINSSIQVLLVEDNEDDAQMIGMFLCRSLEMKVKVEHVTTLGQAVAATHDHEFDAVILDLGLPDNEGLDAVQRIQASALATPIIVLTGQDDGDMAVEAIRIGAQEYLSKEHLQGHLLTRVLRHSMARQEQLANVRAQALTDALTGIANRRAFEVELGRRLADFKRYGTSVCVAIFDVDYFKKINDTFGHDVGDQVLRRIASKLQEQTRDTDLVARFGGEEFTVILPSASIHSVCYVVERVRSVIADSSCRDIDPTLSVTVSSGVAEVRLDDDQQALMRRADEALYAAKEQGRDRCLFHDGEAIHTSTDAAPDSPALAN